MDAVGYTAFGLGAVVMFHILREHFTWFKCVVCEQRQRCDDRILGEDYCRYCVEALAYEERKEARIRNAARLKAELEKRNKLEGVRTEA